MRTTYVPALCTLGDGGQDLRACARGPELFRAKEMFGMVGFSAEALVISTLARP